MTESQVLMCIRRNLQMRINQNELGDFTQLTPKGPVDITYSTQDIDTLGLAFGMHKGPRPNVPAKRDSGLYTWELIK